MTTAPTHPPETRTGRRTNLALPVLAVMLVVLLAGAAVALITIRGTASDSSFSSGVHGSGIAALDSRDLPGFHAIDLAGTNTLALRVGVPQSVVVHADNNLLDHVVTDVRSGELRIANRGSFTTRAPMSVDVTVPLLDSISLTGTGTVTLHGVRGDKLTIRVPGSGTLTASGAVARLDASLGGSGEVDLQDLVAGNVVASLGGAGRLLVNASRSLDASVTGVGSIMYAGSPASVTRTITGVGTIEELRP